MADTQLTVAMCTGKSCRRRVEHGLLGHQLAAADIDVALVSCLGVCRGPVVVLQPGGDDAVVLQRVRGKKARKKLSRLSQMPTTLPKRLREYTVTGGKRNKALLRASKAIERDHRRSS